jgi:hypothetical protein
MTVGVLITTFRTWRRSRSAGTPLPVIRGG